MPLPSSGILKLSQIAAEFGGAAPHALSEYYGAASGIPTSGLLKLSDFYGASARYQAAMVAGSTSVQLFDFKGNPSGTTYYRGFSVGSLTIMQLAHAAIGSLAPPAGPANIGVGQVMTEQFAPLGGASTARMYLGFDGTGHPESSGVWSFFVVPGLGTFGRATGTAWVHGLGGTGSGVFWNITPAQATAITSGTVEII